MRDNTYWSTTGGEKIEEELVKVSEEKQHNEFIFGNDSN